MPDSHNVMVCQLAKYQLIATDVYITHIGVTMSTNEVYGIANTPQLIETDCDDVATSSNEVYESVMYKHC